MKRAAIHALLIPSLVFAVGAGCQATRESRAREYMPDMVRGPAYKAFAPNAGTSDGLTLRRPVPGTIARGQHPFHFQPGEPEAIRAGLALHSPYAPTAAVLDDGKGLFEIYCTPCHGQTGKGDGPLAGKIPPPPAYRSERVLGFPAGRLFHVLTLGSGKMPSYAAQLSPDERWKVIAYVQTALQGKKPTEGRP
ncbi:MAG TPA: cytochrome c [Polyangia bacterium]|jgi:mono/diheme cytochrome c family protein